MFSSRHLVELAVHAVLLAPLVVSSAFIFEFTLARWAWLVVTIFISGAIYLFSKKDDFKIEFTQIDILFSAYTGIILISLLFAGDVHAGLWSSAGRTTGAMLYLIVFLWYLVMRGCAWNANEWKRLSITTISVAGIVAVWGLLQMVVNDEGRASGPTGNALMFGNYLAPYIFLIIFLLVESKRFQFTAAFRWMFSVIGAVTASGVLFSFSRSAYIGLLAGFILSCGYFYSAYRSGKSKIAIYGLMIVGAFLVVGVVGLLSYENITGLKLPVRLKFTSGASQTLGTRLLNWNLALQAIRERPVVGWGWENYRAAADKYFNPKIAENSYYETRIDKPHNVALEMWTTTGTIGLLIYIGLLVVVVISIRRLYQSGAVSALGAWVIGGYFVVHHVQNLFSFDTPQTLFAQAFVLAFIASNDTKTAKSISVRSSIGRAVFLVLFCGIMIPLVIYSGWGTLRTGYYVKQGLDAALEKNFESLDAAHRAAFSGVQGPYEFETWRWFSQALLYEYASGAANIRKLTPDQLRRWNEDVDVLAAQLDRHMKENPDSVEWQTFGGKVAYYIALTRDDNQYLSRAETLFMRAHELSPYRQEAPILLSYIAGLQGDNTKAVMWHGKAVQLAGTEENKTALDFLIAIFVKTKDSDSIIRILEATIEHRPDAETYARLAAVYAETKQFDKAEAAVLEAVKLDPSFAAEAQQFISTFPPHQ